MDPNINFIMKSVNGNQSENQYYIFTLFRMPEIVMFASLHCKKYNAMLEFVSYKEWCTIC